MKIDPNDKTPENCPVCGISTYRSHKMGDNVWEYRIRCDHDPVMLAEKERELNERKAKRAAEILQWRERFVGRKYAGGFAAFNRDLQPEAYDALVEYVKEPKGWIFLTGDVGTGKTALAAAAAMEISLAKPSHERVVFINIADLMAQCRAVFQNDSPGPLEEYCQSYCMVLDDIGIQKRSEFSDETLFRLFDYRMRHEKPMIITSNHTLSEIAGWEGWERIADRIIEEARIIKLKGGSYRRKMAATARAA